MTSRRQTVVAVAVWVLLAVVVWNVVFDRMVVLAGRRYVYDAAIAARRSSYLRVDERMRPAVLQAARVASAAATAVAGIGLAGIAWARRRRRP